MNLEKILLRILLNEKLLRGVFFISLIFGAILFYAYLVSFALPKTEQEFKRICAEDFTEIRFRIEQLEKANMEWAGQKR